MQVRCPKGVSSEREAIVSPQRKPAKRLVSYKYNNQPLIACVAGCGRVVGGALLEILNKSVHKI